ncbi:MAG: diguanylate cyclase [Candidatus Acidiferrales bacterium]
MPQPSDDLQSQPSADDSFLDLLAETLGGVDESVRGQFLRQLFRTIAQIDLSEAKSNEYWERILLRRTELTESLGRRVSLKTALVDVLASANFLRVPVMMEYEEYKKLQVNAATDALTGLYNRRLFDEYCEKELNRAKRYVHHLAVVLLDLHKLKEVNDRFGHMQGDQVLQLAATTLRKTLRASDFAFRIGGDEFALLLPQTDPEQALTLCRRVRSQYEGEIRPLKLGIGVTIDFGIAVCSDDGDSKNVLMRKADERLYQLKHAGRAPSRVIPIETQHQREAPERHAASTPEPAPQEVPKPKPLAAEPEPPSPERPPGTMLSSPPNSGAKSTPAPHREQRKWERVSLSGTKAYAVLNEAARTTASVIDLSYGGVALLLDKPAELPGVFSAVLHVPILPPVRVSLKRTYTVALENGRARVGCSFVS